MTSRAGFRGQFLTIEGPDGSGKTHQSERLAAALRMRGLEVVLTREPGGTRLGDEIRHLLMAIDGAPIDPVADALLFNAARAQHVAEVIRPALQAGAVVISARYADSTLAYQGYGRGVDLDLLRRIIAMATDGLRPDRTFLLDLPVEVGLERKTPDTLTRFEAAYDLAFHRRVRAGFLELAAAEPDRFVCVDAARDEDSVLADLLASALDLIGEGGARDVGDSLNEPPASVARIPR